MHSLSFLKKTSELPIDCNFCLHCPLKRCQLHWNYLEQNNSGEKGIQDWSLTSTLFFIKDKQEHEDLFYKQNCFWAILLQVCIIYLKQPFSEERLHGSNSYFSLGRRSTASSLAVPFLHVSKACSVRLKLPRQPVLSQETAMPKNFPLLSEGAAESDPHSCNLHWDQGAGKCELPFKTNSAPELRCSHTSTIHTPPFGSHQAHF